MAIGAELARKSEIIGVLLLLSSTGNAAQAFWNIRKPLRLAFGACGIPRNDNWENHFSRVPLKQTR